MTDGKVDGAPQTNLEMNKPEYYADLAFAANNKFTTGAGVTGMQLKVLSEGGSGSIHDPDVEPDGGWDAWFVRMSTMGAVSRILKTKAKNIMSFSWSSPNEDAIKFVETAARQLDLYDTLVQARIDWESTGRCFIEPVWVVKPTTVPKFRKIWERIGLTSLLKRLYNREEVLTKINGDIIQDIHKVKLLNPTTISVFWNSYTDISALSSFLSDAIVEPQEKATLSDYQNGAGDVIVFADESALPYVEATPIGNGDEIVGFVQTVNSGGISRSAFMFPDELIYLRRYPTHTLRNGVSICYENRVTINNIQMIESALTVRASRFTDPIMNFKIPQELWANRDTIRKGIKLGRELGVDTYTPTGVEYEIIDGSGSEDPTNGALKYLQEQLNTGFGWADSFYSSESSNRSVGEVQTKFYERDIEPERQMFSKAIEEKLIKPMCFAQGFSADAIPTMEFENLIPENKREWANVLMSLMPYMDVGQVIALFEYVGLPVTDESNVKSAKQLELQIKVMKVVNLANGMPASPSGDIKTPGMSKEFNSYIEDLVFEIDEIAKAAIE